MNLLSDDIQKARRKAELRSTLRTVLYVLIIVVSELIFVLSAYYPHHP